MKSGIAALIFARRLTLRGAAFACRLAILVIPTIYLACLGVANFGEKLDVILAHSAPLVSAEISRQLKRSVSIGHLSHGQTVRSLITTLRHPETAGTLEVTGENVVIGPRNSTYTDTDGKLYHFDEERLAGTNIIARAPRVNLFVAVPSVLAGDFSRSLTRVEVESPELTLIRDVNGQLNMMQITESKPNSKPSPPFRTFIHVSQGRLHFCDYATARAPGHLALNDISNVTGDADLTSGADYRFAASALATPNTATAARLHGGLNVNGMWGRSTPGASPDHPAIGSARFLIRARANEADLPYWFYYFLNVGHADKNSADHRDSFRLERGTGNVALSLAGPRPDITSGPTPGIGISLAAQFDHVNVSTDYLTTVPITEGYGSVDYADGSVEFNVGASALGRPIVAAGELWGVTPDKSRGAVDASVSPEVAVNFHGTGLPISRIVSAIFPHGGVLPPGLRTSGDVSVDGIVSGPLRNVVAAGRFSGLDLGYNGLPSARNIAANLTYVDGVVAVTEASGSLENGGPLSGHGAIRVLGGSAGEISNSQFAVNVQDLDLLSLDAIRRADSASNATLQIHGRGQAEIIGTRRGGTLSVAANIRTSGLTIGKLAVPVARARIILTQETGAPIRLVMTAGRVESPAGAVRVSGDFVDGGKLSLLWRANALDLKSLGHAVGYDRLEGLVSAAGTVDGPVGDPRVVVRELAGLNLRFSTGTDGNASTGRQFAVDSLRGVNLVVNRAGVEIREPLVVRHFPAEATLTGTIAGLFDPAKNAVPNAPIDPTLNLTASVQRLEISDIEAQFAAVNATLNSAGQAVDVSPQVAQTEPAFVAGAISDATVTIKGPASDPRVSASAVLGRMIVGSYPIDGGLVDLTYADRKLDIQKASLTASLGTITASGTMLPNGNISGTFAAPRFDTEKLSFLTQRVASVAGTLDLSGAISGSQTRPVVTASLSPSTLTVAGTKLDDVTFSKLKYEYDVDKKSSRITIPTFSFRQANSDVANGAADTAVTLTDSVMNLPTGVVTANLTAHAGDIGVLLRTLQKSGLRDTTFGNSIVSSIDNLPSIGGQFSIDHLTLGAVIVRKSGPDGSPSYGLASDSAGDVSISGKDIRFGTFTAPIIQAHAKLDKSVIDLDKFTAVIPETPTSQGITVRSHGTFGFDGSINAVVESNAVAIDSLRTIPQIQSLPLRGSFDVSVLVRRSDGATNVTASLQGNNIDYLTGSNVMNILGTPAEATAPAFRLDQLRAEGEYSVDKAGIATITIPEALVSHGNISLTLEGTVPLDTKTAGPPKQGRSIALTATLAHVDLADLASLVKTYGKKDHDGKPVELGGTVAAKMSVAGTLEAPVLSGDLLVSKAHFTFPHGIDDDKDRINPIKNLDAHVVLDNGVFTIAQCLLTLGAPNGQKGDFGTVSVAGTVTPNVARTVSELIDGQASSEKELSDFLSETALNVSATFKGMRPFEDDLFGFGESVQARIDGTLVASGDPKTGKGSLAAPLITAAQDKPIQIADAVLKLTPVRATEQKPSPPLAINPQFPSGTGLPIAIGGKAVITDGSSYRFEANGTANVTGNLGSSSNSSGTSSSNLGVTAILNVLGGYYKLPTAVFKVQKSNDTTAPSTIELRYGGERSEVIAHNIQAKVPIHVRAGTTISASNRASQNSLLNVQNAQASSPTTSYTIVVTINGPLNFLNDPNSPAGAGAGPKLTFVTDPYLDDQQIVALLGGQSQVQEAANGNVTGAIGSLGYQYAATNFLPSVLSPITDGIQNALGLDAFDLDYDPQGNSLVHVSKRISETAPFDRFVVEYTQQIQTRSLSQATTVQPYLFSLSYDLFRINATSKRLQPVVQVGFSNDYLNVDQFFLRGTMSF